MEKTGIAIFSDFRKAFDTIEWNYINTALKLFNFGPDLLNWFAIFYHQVSSCVINNSHASEFSPYNGGLDKVARYRTFCLWLELSFLPGP